MKNRKVYELYWSMGGPSPQSKHYYGVERRLWQVAAVSVKQAVWLAAHDRWYAGSGTGILSHHANGAGHHRYWDGVERGYTHGRVFNEPTDG